MHIALVRREMTLQRSGAERMCVNLLRHLVAQGHRVTVLAEHFDVELRDGAEFVPIYSPRWWNWSRTQAFAHAAERALRKRQFDVVHGLARVPGVDVFHALDPIHAHWLTVQYPRAWEAQLQRRNPRHRSILDLERQLYHPAGPRQIIVQSAFDRDLLRTHYQVAAGRITVIPNGVDLREFSLSARNERVLTRQKLGIGDDAKLLLFAGSDFRRKGLETLLRTLPLLAGSNTHLLVAGDGPIPRYAALAEQLGVSTQVRFLGKVTQMSELYAAADLLVLPTRYDPFASVVLESLACGTPAVTSICGGAALALDDALAGSVFQDPLNCEELAVAITQQLAIRVDRRELCAHRARQFTAESYARQTLEVLATVAERKAA